MNEEEKKAIKIMEEVKARNVHTFVDELSIVLNLIEKQQKEIEKYKDVINNREFTWKQKYEETFEYVKENYISKDKIRDKQIEREFELQQEYKDFENDIQWKIYKELLEENNEM